MSEQTETEPPFEVVSGSPMQVMRWVPSFVGRCNICGLIALDHETEHGARQEMQRHIEEDHPEAIEQCARCGMGSTEALREHAAGLHGDQS